MLRITKAIDENSSEVMLKLAGRLAAEWVALLESEWLLCQKEKSKVRLDFADVTFVDDQGLRRLRRLAASNVGFVDPIGFITDSLLRRGED